MTKEELKKQNKDILNKKQEEYYKKVNDIITYANDNKDLLIIKNSENQLDNLIAKLFDRVINTINKIKLADNEEWNIIDNLINQINDDIKNIIDIDWVNKHPELVQIQKDRICTTDAGMLILDDILVNIVR